MCIIMEAKYFTTLRISFYTCSMKDMSTILHSLNEN